jgi:diaminopimelate decarboxylase
VVRDCWLPADIAPGDLLAVAATGAYCYSMASNYNRVPRPPVIAVAAGTPTLIVRRERMDEVMATDVGWADPPAASQHASRSIDAGALR